MAVHQAGIFSPSLEESIKSSKILVVGAGGIGCELLKNLVLTGFEDLEVIDLDTIDVSNLNRQFLFHKQHVGKSKSEVARDSAIKFNPAASIIAYHDSVISPKYSMSFYKQFALVMNALDNRTARNHVNRMCLAADIPLIESGTSGYLGQVTVIKKQSTECYECQPKATQKTFPGCTIRNTPSEPIHCIVWAKHLFNQLFGEADADEDVSPDSADPEQIGEAGKSALEPQKATSRVSTRAWAASHNFDCQKLFKKLFVEDIQYLLSMDKLWQNRRPPTPMVWSKTCSEATADFSSLIQDQRPWSASQCCIFFEQSINNLKHNFSKLKEGDHLVWDKDDKDAMDFVTACANIRSHIFGITQKTRFDVKSMAGNIIPAIATTNAIIAALIVLQAMKMLSNKFADCRTVYLNRKPNPRKRLLVPCILDQPNPKCYVCSEKPEVTVQLNIHQTTIKGFEEKILKSALNMVAPDVDILDGKGTIIISSEPGETEGNANKMMADFSIQDGTRLNCDDFLQDYNLCIIISQCDQLEDGLEFKVIGDPEKLKAEQEQAERAKAKLESQNASASTDQSETVEDDDDFICLDDIVEEPKKRKAQLPNGNESSAKKPRLDNDIQIE